MNLYSTTIETTYKTVAHTSDPFEEGIPAHAKVQDNLWILRAAPSYKNENTWLLKLSC